MAEKFALARREALAWAVSTRADSGGIEGQGQHRTVTGNLHMRMGEFEVEEKSEKRSAPKSAQKDTVSARIVVTNLQ
jgi:hypothetical protein